MYESVNMVSYVGGGGERACSPNRLEYTSDRHPRVMLDMMNLLRQSHELCDVVLNVGSHEPIYAHR